MIKYEKLKDEDKKVCQIAFRSLDLLRKFGNKANLKMFETIFGNDKSEKLWEHYVRTCDRNILKFYTYLTQDQLGDLYANIYFNEHLHIK